MRMYAKLSSIENELNNTRTLGTFYYFPEWVLENHREHGGHRENSNSLCPPCPLWLIFFAIIRVHPEEIKKSLTLLRRPKRVVSLRGIAKSLVSDEELENSIKEANKSLLKGADDVSVVW